ncbi:MAG: HAMP domain-containing protein, partial [Chloroflexota bacterium]|nr:HAMP domain-containing protein [Chloroflexota bacterium]
MTPAPPDHPVTRPARLPRTLPIRRSLVLFLIAMFVIPIIVSAVTGIIVTATHSRAVWYSTGERALERLRADVAQWSDPAWQADARADLAADGIAFVLSDGDRELFRSTADPAMPTDPGAVRVSDRMVLPGPDGDRIARVYADEAQWYPAFEIRWVIPVTGLVAILATVLGGGWFMGRTVVRPLAAASAAVRQAATGDLDLALPSSRVREVADLTAALQSMSDELRASLHHQAELEQERRLFISAIAHDLRTPLFSLRGY